MVLYNYMKALRLLKAPDPRRLGANILRAVTHFIKLRTIYIAKLVEYHTGVVVKINCTWVRFSRP